MNDDIKQNLHRLLLLHDSRANPITRREIRQILEFPDDRQLRKYVHELRQDGLPIFFATETPAGYYLPANQTEFEEGMRKWWKYLYNLGQDYKTAKQVGTRWLLPATQRRMF